MTAVYKLRQILNTQLPIELDFLLLANGLHERITKDETDFNGDDVSLLQPQTDVLGFSDYQVYQSRFKNWVWESGVSTELFTAPSLVIDVFKNDLLQVRGTDYDVDYINGQVIFTSANVASDEVKASFTYKKVFVALTSDEQNLLIQSTGENQEEDVGPIYPQPNEIIMPAVFINTDSRVSDPMCIGTTGKKMRDTVFFDVYSENQELRDRILDILSYFEDSNIDLIDWENVDPVFNDIGDLGSGFTNIVDYKENNFLYRAYFNNVKIRNIIENKSFYRGVAESEVETWIFATPV